MDQNKPKKSNISTGTTSIVLIFVLLSMLTFSVLSLISAQANLRLSRLSAERTTAYYEAENAANDVLLRVNAVLEEARSAAEDEAAFYAMVQSELFNDETVEIADESHLTWQVPLGDNQVLAVELAVSYEPTAQGRHYTIASWQAVSGYDWNPDHSLNLMGGGGLPIF